MASSAPDTSGPIQVTTSGFVVSDATAALLALLALAGVALDRPELTAVGTLVLVLTVVARLWTRVALESVICRCDLSSSRVVEGDELVLTLTLENHKPIPVPWVRVHEAIPRGLELVDGSPRNAGAFGTTALSTTTALGVSERVRLRFRLRARARGHYVLGPGRLTSGDPFGFYEADRIVVRSTTTLLVYPQLDVLAHLDIALARPFGERVAGARMIADPTRPRSVREYARGDPWRAIDWKVTARHGTPWVRVHDGSVDASVMLLLECETRTSGVWSDSPERLECAIRTAGALARDLLLCGHAVGIIANGVPPGDRARAAVAPAAGPAQLAGVLETLARVQPLIVKPLSSLVNEHIGRTVGFGATVVCIAARAQADTLRVLDDRRRRGASTLLVLVSDDDPEEITAVRTVRVPVHLAHRDAATRTAHVQATR